MRISEGDRDFSLLRLMPMIQKVILSCWDREKYPYTKSQLTLIMALLHKESLTMKEAASYISSSKEQATRAVAPLVDKGLMERYTDPANRNYVHIQLTDTGRTLVLEMLDGLYDNINKLLDQAISNEEKLALRDSLTESIRILNKVL